jgi:Bacterial Ig-like domain (group 2)
MRQLKSKTNLYCNCCFRGPLLATLIIVSVPVGVAAPPERKTAPPTSGTGVQRTKQEPSFSRSVPAKLLSIQLQPQEATLWGHNAAQRFIVIGNFSDGLARDITESCRFTLSNTQLAKLEPQGRVLGHADGQVVLKAETGGHAARTNIRILESQQRLPFSFARDIGGILTKKGCNSSDCHGSVKGKGGFKLSMNALYPREDYKWIVEGGAYQVLTTEVAGQRIPRVSLTEPEKSLLLQKPSFAVAHGGGQLMTEGSADYQAVLNWIRNGTPYGAEGGESVHVTGVELFPKEVVLDSGGKHQLLVTARLSNGRKQDFTDQVMYSTSNADVVKVSAAGLAEAVTAGETAVMIRAAGFAATARFGVISKPIAAYPKVPKKQPYR